MWIRRNVKVKTFWLINQLLILLHNVNTLAHWSLASRIISTPYSKTDVSLTTFMVDHTSGVSMDGKKCPASPMVTSTLDGTRQHNNSRLSTSSTIWQLVLDLHFVGLFQSDPFTPQGAEVTVIYLGGSRTECENVKNARRRRNQPHRFKLWTTRKSPKSGAHFFYPSEIVPHLTLWILPTRPFPSHFPLLWLGISVATKDGASGEALVERSCRN